jgi:hypothetical protein
MPGVFLFYDRADRWCFSNETSHHRRLPTDGITIKAQFLLLQAQQCNANNHRHEHTHSFKWLVVGSLIAATKAFCMFVKREQGRDGFSGRPFCLTARSPQRQMQQGNL